MSVKSYYADTSFVIDLMNAEQAAVDKLEEIENITTGVPVIYELNKFPDFRSDLICNTVELNAEDVRVAGEIWKKLKSDGEMVGEVDYLIAGQVINRGMTLLTRDRDFEKFERAEIELYGRD